MVQSARYVRETQSADFMFIKWLTLNTLLYSRLQAQRVVYYGSEE